MKVSDSNAGDLKKLNEFFEGENVVESTSSSLNTLINWLIFFDSIMWNLGLFMSGKFGIPTGGFGLGNSSGILIGRGKTSPVP
jgi:hypothetical protein